MAARFLRRIRRSSTSKVNFSVLTKRWAPILLSKLSENSALSGKSAVFSDNFGSNIGAQRFVNTEKFTFEVDDLRKRAGMMAHDDDMSLAYKRHEY